MRFQDKVVLVLGGNSGMGLAAARAFAAEGATIVLNGFGDKLQIEDTRQKLEHTHDVAAFYHGADLSKAAAVVSAISAAASALTCTRRSAPCRFTLSRVARPSLRPLR